VGALFGLGGVQYLSDIMFETSISVIITDKDIMLNMSKFNFLSYEEWKIAKQNIILELNTTNTMVMSEQNYSESMYVAEKEIFFKCYNPHIIEQNYLDNVTDFCDNAIKFQNEKVYNEYMHGYRYIRIEECINKGKIVEFYWETMINNVNVKD